MMRLLSRFVWPDPPLRPPRRPVSLDEINPDDGCTLELRDGVLYLVAVGMPEGSLAWQERYERMVCDG